MEITKNRIIKSTLLNVDSAYREINPKHIFNTNGLVLPNNPITTTKNSNIIKINYPGHELVAGDRIIIQNVQGKTKKLSNSFFLFNDWSYLAIDYGLTGIPTDYKNIVYVIIELVGDQTEDNLISNMPLNSFIGFQRIYLPSEINNKIPIPSYVLSYFSKYQTMNDLDANLLLIKLPFNYTLSTGTNTMVNQIFKITFQDVNGIRLGYLNTNYPINNYQYQSEYQVATVIDKNNFTIELNVEPNSSGIGGGSLIQVMKILNTLTGYPYANEYEIFLKKSFTNVINIELVSSEFPYVDLLIKKNINDKIYWQNYEDGPYVYSATIKEGTYNTSDLLTELTSSLNSVERITSTTESPVFNLFEITFNAYNRLIQFYGYKNTKLPNSFSITTKIIDSDNYYILRITHPNSFLQVGDTITIANADDTTIKFIDTGLIFAIAASYLNTTHTVYTVDTISDSYTVILGKVDQIVADAVGAESRGGQNTTIKSKELISLLFNYRDTIGDVIGFKNVGQDFAITPFQFIVSNIDPYVNDPGFNSVGDINLDASIINLSGRNNYLLMYLNDIEFIYNNNGKLPSAFAKILLSGNPGDILFNTFVKQPIDLYSDSFPIATLDKLSIKFLFPDGTKPDFRNMNHSFTLRIVEETIQASNTRLNSNNTSWAKEMIQSSYYASNYK